MARAARGLHLGSRLRLKGRKLVVCSKEDGAASTRVSFHRSKTVFSKARDSLASAEFNVTVFGMLDTLRRYRRSA